MRPVERAKANALALRANGLSISQVAERLGVPRGTVGQWLRGRGEWYEVRECRLCGERFIAGSGIHRFCTPQHAAKYRSVFGPSSGLAHYCDRARELEAELARLRAQLEARRAS
jgi:transcriptional regulator with XRE-family HTH domain